MILGSKSNIRAWYKFNGNANDSSGNGYNGTVNGATLTTDKWGNSNLAYSFDGNDSIDTFNFTGLTNTILEVIYMRTGANGYNSTEGVWNTIYSDDNFAYAADGVWVHTDNNGSGSRVRYQGTDDNVVNIWYYSYLEIVSNVAKLFDNSEEVTLTAEAGTSSDYRGGGWIGRNGYNTPPLNTNVFFVGKIQEVKLSSSRKSKLSQLWQYRTQNYRKAI